MELHRNFVPQNLTIEWGEIAPLLDNLKIRNIDSVVDLKQWLSDKSELESVLQENFAWRYIRMTCDTTNEQFVQDFQYFATEIEPKMAPIANQLNEKLIQNSHVEALEKEEKYRILFRKIRKEIALYRDENVSLFTQMQVEQQQYQSIAGSMTVQLDGKECTLEQAAVYLKNPNRNLRQEAFEKITTRRLQDKEKLDDLFNRLLKIRHQIALNAGYTNYRDYMFDAMGRFDYAVDDCLKFHEAIEKNVVPFLKDIANQRAEKLKLFPLKPWDTEVDLSGLPPLQPFRNGNDLIDKTITCFEHIEPYFGHCLREMKKHQFFDVESRKGKAPGGYNYPLAETGMPFIFMNSANSFRDLTTMVHEGGHAIHTFLTSELEINDFKNCPSEIAELASMSMELISMREWGAFFENEKDLQRAKCEQLIDVLKTLPWVATVDAFQHWLYTHPEHTVTEREQAWLALFNRFGANFVDWADYSSVSSNLWQKQLHIFEVPFYYIEYGMAQLGAIGVWKNCQENYTLGLEKYKAALKLGYTQTIPNVYQTAGIKFDFSSEYVAQLVAFVGKELNIINNG